MFRSLIFWLFLPTILFIFHVLPLMVNIKISIWVIVPLLILTTVAFASIDTEK